MIPDVEFQNGAFLKHAQLLRRTPTVQQHEGNIFIAAYTEAAQVAQLAQLALSAGCVRADSGNAY